MRDVSQQSYERADYLWLNVLRLFGKHIEVIGDLKTRQMFIRVPFIQLK